MASEHHREIEFGQVERSMASSLHAHCLQDIGVSLCQYFHMHVMLRFEIGDERAVARGFVGENCECNVELIGRR